LVNRIIEDKNRVKNVKLKINPDIIIQGLSFDCCPPKLVDNTIGSIGSMHGESIVTNPDKKANSTRRIIINLTSPDQKQKAL